MAVRTVSKIELSKIHNRYNLSVDFFNDLNVIHGKNGAGKSTLIHVIANIVNGDFIRFAFLTFEEIKATYSDGLEIEIRRDKVEDLSYISVALSNGKSIRFAVEEAMAAVREIESDRHMRDRDVKSMLVMDINRFVKENELQKVSASYFPAFRTMLEAWSSSSDVGYERRALRPSFYNRKASVFARELFGHFLPSINYPSPMEIEERLREEIRRAQLGIAAYESRTFSESFVKVFSALFDNSPVEGEITGELLKEIEGLAIAQDSSIKNDYYAEYSKVYEEIRSLINRNLKGKVENSVSGALVVYRDALRDRQDYQEKAFSEIDNYMSSVNSFLEDKEMAYDFDLRRKYPKVGLKFPDGSWSPIRVLSSGERQLLTMLYAASKMGDDAIVLIDEPEISLHIDWQEDLLKRMLSQLSGRQIIVCTHSPSIATGYEDFMINISPEFISSRDDNNHKDSEEMEEDESL
ncbi:AAA family ATPase [Atlantibacter hermannii]|uniref:AAA family ATPase n=1 Tax=Atlantibacter hermannii TaxID=565 RepID=UPI0028AE14B5|nr:AAA family ATPase [Atlantibacter hermannii]